jgi:hypothetical protein
MQLEVGALGRRRATTPAATWAFCSRMAVTTSPAVMLRGELLRVEPDAHRVVARAEQQHRAHAGDAQQVVAHVERVVAQVERVVASCPGETMCTTMVRLGDCFSVVTPIWRTMSGRRGSARLMRFCTAVSAARVRCRS